MFFAKKNYPNFKQGKSYSLMKMIQNTGRQLKMKYVTVAGPVGIAPRLFSTQPSLQLVSCFILQLLLRCP